MITLDWSAARSFEWSQCPFAFWLRHVRHIAPSQPADNARLFGRLAHAGCQAAYEAAREDPAPPGSTMSHFVGEAMWAIQHYASEDGRDIPRRSRTDASVLVESTLGRLAAPAPGGVIAVEHAFTLEIDGVIVRGVIDLGLLTSATSIHLRDWKTGKVPGDAMLHPALNLYRRAARQEWPDIPTVTTGLYPLRTGEEAPVEPPPEVEEFAIGRLMGHHAEAVQALNAVQDGASILDWFPVNEGPHCAKCSHKSFCPLFGSAPLPVRDEAAVKQDKELVRQLIND